jgi:hypothetical protein
MKEARVGVGCWRQCWSKGHLGHSLAATATSLRHVCEVCVCVPCLLAALTTTHVACKSTAPLVETCHESLRGHMAMATRVIAWPALKRSPHHGHTAEYRCDSSAHLPAPMFILTTDTAVLTAAAALPAFAAMATNLCPLQRCRSRASSLLKVKDAKRLLASFALLQSRHVLCAQLATRDTNFT